MFFRTAPLIRAAMQTVMGVYGLLREEERILISLNSLTMMSVSHAQNQFYKYSSSTKVCASGCAMRGERF